MKTSSTTLKELYKSIDRVNNICLNDELSPLAKLILIDEENRLQYILNIFRKDNE